jgi:polysaccharide biosynthesis protein PslH
MGYAPNDEGARWLITRIWPRLRRQIRSPLRLLIAGSNPAPSLVRLGRRHGVTVTGTVPDIGAFYGQADLALVPIRAGGGTRIKLLEAAAHGVPVVSTTFGAEGTTFRHRRDLLIADGEREFAHACVAMLQRPRYAQALAARARCRAAQDYSAKRWAERLAGRITDLRQREHQVAERGG